MTFYTNGKDLKDRYVKKSMFKTSGNMYVWGGGIVGLNTTTTYSSPVQLNASTDWISASVGSNYIVATKTDGTLWAWGANAYGNLGFGDKTDRSSPVQVGSLTDWNKVSTAYKHTSAVKPDGTLWVWGDNQWGKLGLGDTANTRWSPVQVGTLSDWKYVSGGWEHTTAIKTDGTLWAWGNNSFGQLGQSNTTHRSSPVQVGYSKDWKTVFSGKNSTVAMKIDGTLWAWGNNSFGQLGQNDLTYRYSPVQVGTKSWFRYIHAADTVFAIATDNTIWGWGDNVSNFISPSSSPSQVSSTADWIKVFTAGDSSVIAMKFNGDLYAAGDYPIQYGNNTTTYNFSLQLVNSDQTWSDIAIGPVNAAISPVVGLKIV